MENRKPILDNQALNCKWFLPVLIAVIAICCIFFQLKANHTTTDPDAPPQLTENPDDLNNNSISALPLGMYMTVTDLEDGIATITISNQSGYEMEYPATYALEMKINGTWEALETDDPMFFPMVMYTIADLEEVEETCDLTPYGELDRGHYRLIKGDMVAEFTLQ